MAGPLTALTDTAAAAYAAKKAAEEAALSAARQQLNQAATAALTAVLTYKDAAGATVTKTMTELGLTRVHRDLTVGPPASGVVVWSDGTVHLAAQLNREGAWVVRLVEGSGSSWTPRLGADGNPVRIRDLADLGAALAG